MARKRGRKGGSKGSIDSAMGAGAGPHLRGMKGRKKARGKSRK